MNPLMTRKRMSLVSPMRNVSSDCGCRPHIKSVRYFSPRRITPARWRCGISMPRSFPTGRSGQTPSRGSSTRSFRWGSICWPRKNTMRPSAPGISSWENTLSMSVRARLCSCMDNCIITRRKSDAGTRGPGDPEKMSIRKPSPSGKSWSISIRTPKNLLWLYSR